jgi:hypothetical protein
MKKLTLLAVSLLLLSCSADEVEEKTCNCEKLARTNTMTVNPNTGQVTTSAWTFTGGREFYSNDCSDNGYNYIQTSSISGNTQVNIGWIVKCR